MSRTTLDLDPTILMELRRRGQKEGKSMGQLASELLASSLDERCAGDAPPEFVWDTWDLGAPRVDLEDKEAVRLALGRDR